MTTDLPNDPQSFSDAQTRHTNARFDLPLSQEALDALPYPLGIYTLDGLCIAINTEAEKFFRVSRDAIVGNFNILTDPAMQDPNFHRLFHAATQGQRVQADPVYYDFSLPDTRDAPKTGVWIEITFFPFRDSAGNVTHVAASILDVSDRIASKEQQQQLRIFETLFEHAPDAIGMFGVDGRVTYANAAYRTLYGYGDETIGVDWTALCPPDTLDRLGEILEAINAQGFWRGIVDQQDRYGRRFPAQASVFRLYNDEGKPFIYASIIRDVSEAQQRETELRVFKNLVERAPEGIMIADAQGYCIYVNPAMQALYGSPDMIGLHGPSLDAEGPEQTQALMQQPIEQGVVRVETYLRRSDGSTLPVGTVSYRLDQPDGSYVFISFIHDLTEERRREQERQALQEQVIQAQQAALRELSTPLIPIAEGVVVMPLIGSIDSSRAQLVMETLLSGVAERRANTAIIDITGVSVIDTQVADALIRAAQAVKLLGAQVILTGIRPEVAQTLVMLGVDLSGIITRSTLQSGIAEALNGAARRVLHPSERGAC